SNEIDLLEKSELNDFTSNLEAWTAIGTNKEMSYATHGVYRYFGKFPPPIATHLIKEHTREGELINDPMSGSATTGVEALLLNRKCILNDISPLSELLAEVKTTYIERAILEEALIRVEKNYRPLSEEDYEISSLNTINIEHWFLPETVKSLRGLRFVIEEEKNCLVKKFLLLAFSSTVRRVSRATMQQGRLFLDVETARKDAMPTFIKRANIALDAVSNLPKQNSSTINFFQHNLKEPMLEKYNNSFGLVILHPPYFNSYKYSRINSLELAWLGYKPAEIRKSEVREFFKRGIPEKVDFYVEDMVNVIKNIKSSLRPNGVIALMIGDTIIKGQYIPVTKMILEKVKEEGFDIEKIALRVPKYTEATWAASQRRKKDNIGITLYDYIITLRRKA